MKKVVLKIFAILFCLSFLCLSANSTEAASLAPQDSSAQKEKNDLDKRNKELKLFLDKIEIMGRIEKPQTVFIIQGQDPSIDDIQIDRSFFREIFRKVEREDLRKMAARKLKKKNK